MKILGSSPDHLDAGAETELGDDLGQEGGPTQKWLDQRDREIGTSDGQHQTGEPGPCADVADRRVLRDNLAQDRRVEEVTIPQPGRLARSDEAAHHSLRRQQLRVALGQRQLPGREHPPRRLGYRGRDRGCQLTPPQLCFT